MAHVYACLLAQRRGPIGSLSGSKTSRSAWTDRARFEQFGLHRRQNARFWKWTFVLAIFAAEVPSASLLRATQLARRIGKRRRRPPAECAASLYSDKGKFRSDLSAARNVNMSECALNQSTLQMPLSQQVPASSSGGAHRNSRRLRVSEWRFRDQL